MRDLALAALGWLMIGAPLVLCIGLSYLALRERKAPAPDPMQTAYLNDSWGQWPRGPVQ